MQMKELISNYNKTTTDENILMNIKQREGIGLKFIIKCFFAWIFRLNKNKS